MIRSIYWCNFYANRCSGFRGVVRLTYTRNLVSVAFSMRDTQYQTCVMAGFDKTCLKYVSSLQLRHDAANNLRCVSACDIFICPIAIAYSMGQIIKSVCICVSVCLSVCPSVGTLTVAFLDRFSPKLAQT